MLRPKHRPPETQAVGLSPPSPAQSVRPGEQPATALATLHLTREGNWILLLECTFNNWGSAVPQCWALMFPSSPPDLSTVSCSQQQIHLSPSRDCEQASEQHGAHRTGSRTCLRNRTTGSRRGSFIYKVINSNKSELCVHKVGGAQSPGLDAARGQPLKFALDRVW